MLCWSNVMSLAIRRRRPGEPDSIGRRQPVALVHVDQTAASSIARVHKHLPASDVPKLLEGRFQIINLWRPIGAPALDWPLALCDYRSFDLEKDTFPASLIAAAGTGEVLVVKYNENHKWKFLHGMTPEDIVLFKWQVHPLINLVLCLTFLFISQALIPLGTGALLFAPHIPLSVTQPPPLDHPFDSQLNSGSLCSMTEWASRR